MLIKKILKYLGLWEVAPPEVWRVKERPPPHANALSKYRPSIDYSHRGVGEPIGRRPSPSSLYRINGYM